jgi:hypothetical protein
LLDVLFLHLQLLSTFAMHPVGYGMPRAGNAAFADSIDGGPNVGLTRLNNMNDTAPILPGRFLEFQYASGEVRIGDDGGWYASPGPDNTNDKCSTGSVTNLFQGDVGDHAEPYNDISPGSD